MHDFDWAMVYGSLHWGSAEPGSDALGPAPQAVPKFKWIGFTGQVLRHPDWSDERQVADLRRQIDRALELGYDVLVVRLWDMDLVQLEVATGMVADSADSRVRRLLHGDYVATPAFTEPVAGAVHRLRRKNRVARPARPAAGNLRALHLPVERTRIVDRQVLGATIVPERDRAGLPAKPAGEFGPMTVIHQEVEQRTALVFRHALETAGIGVVHEQAFAAGLGWVRTTGWMFSVGRQLASSRTLMERRASPACGPATLMSLCTAFSPASIVFMPSDKDS